MKKTLILLAFLLAAALFLVGCSDSDDPQASNGNGPPSQSTNDGFELLFRGVNISPGQPFDVNDFSDDEPTVNSIPSSAFPDDPVNVYIFDGELEISAVTLGGVETIYMVHVLGESFSTTRGVSVGDDVSRILELYGDDYENGIRMSYIFGDVDVSFLVIDGTVRSIEYWTVGLVY